MNNIEKIKTDLKNNLSEFRYEHSLLVATCAVSLAEHYHLDTDDAYVAGLLHDIAKEYTEEQNKEYPVESKFLTTEYSPVLHAIVGALVAKDKYGMDTDICQAIRYHALGDIKMNLFDKVIFIADKIGRKHLTPSLEQIKSLAYHDIDSAIILYLQEKKEKLSKKNECFLNESLVLLDYLCKSK